MKQQKPIFKTSIISLIICIIISLIYVQKGDTERNAFENIKGIIVSINNTNELYIGKDTSKFRYVQIDNYPQPFQIFIGKSTGDFKPKFEQIDLLNIGDSISIYFEETFKTKNAAVNNLVYFIDRKSEVIFIKGNAIKGFIYGLMIFCFIFICVLVFLKKRGKIF
jgi:hypothetical protein